MKKTITKPEVKVMKLQKMNVIATSGDTPKTFNVGGDGFQDEGNSWRNSSSAPKAKKF